MLAILRARWPAAFTALVPLPLAVGIQHEIKRALGEGRVPARRLGGALFHWTYATAYLAAAANGVRRVHLDGMDAGEPDEGQRRYARGVLAERKIWMRPPAAPAPPAVGEGGAGAAETKGERADVG